MIGALLLLVGAGMLWSACGKLLHPASIPSVHITALWVALAALTAKEMLFRYMLRAAKQIQSSMLIGQRLARPLGCRVVGGGRGRHHR